MGFPRLTANSHRARELGEDGWKQPSPKRKQKGIDGDTRDSQSCSQSQGDDSKTIGDEMSEEVSSVGRGRKRGKARRNKESTNEKRLKHSSQSPSQRNGSQDSDARDA